MIATFWRVTYGRRRHDFKLPAARCLFLMTLRKYAFAGNMVANSLSRQLGVSLGQSPSKSQGVQDADALEPSGYDRRTAFVGSCDQAPDARSI
jgi:hypothetical protein